MIVALAGKADHVDLTRGYLQDRLVCRSGPSPGCSPNCGSMATSQPGRPSARIGETTGLRVDLLDALLPYWESDQPVVVGQGVTTLTWEQGLTSNQVPLRWLVAGEFRPAAFRSDRHAKDLVHKGSLGRDVVGRHGTHLSLCQHRHGLDAGEGSPSGPKALKAEHRPCSALDPAMVAARRSGWDWPDNQDDGQGWCRNAGGRGPTGVTTLATARS